MLTLKVVWKMAMQRSAFLQYLGEITTQHHIKMPTGKQKRSLYINIV